MKDYQMYGPDDEEDDTERDDESYYYEDEVEDIRDWEEQLWQEENPPF